MIRPAISLQMMQERGMSEKWERKGCRRFLKEKIHSIRLFFLIQTDSASAGFPEMLQGFLRNIKRRFHRPAQPLLCQTDFLNAERLSVGRRGILLVGTAEADVGTNLQSTRAGPSLAGQSRALPRFRRRRCYSQSAERASRRRRNEPRGSSVKASSVLPSIVIWLSA